MKIEKVLIEAFMVYDEETDEYVSDSNGNNTFNTREQAEELIASETEKRKDKE